MKVSLLDTFEKVENPAGLKTKILKEISWKKLHSKIEQKYPELPGGSYYFCVDDDRNVYLIEWSPVGDKESALVLKVGRLER
jgi:hypothetical protein